MNEHILNAVAHFLNRVGGDDDDDMEVVVLNSTNGASANSQGPPVFRVTTRPRRSAMRLYARRLTNDECLRAVEEGGVTGEDACPICLEEKMKQPVQLIHHDKRGGDGKANLCKTAMCFSCLQDCIKTQKPQQRGLIRPQCPCCRGNIYKAVTLTEPNVVLDIPNFHPLTYGVLLRDAARLSLTFGYDRLRREAGGWNITKWAIQTPVESRAKIYMKAYTQWNALFNNAGSTMFRSQFQNFPEQREIMEALKRKIEKLNELSNIPRVLRLTLEDYLAEEKAKAARNTVVDLTDSPKKKKRKKAKAVEESAGCCGSCSKPSSK
ncbi:MAG: hypothetical protein CMO44_13835 [Verrucomicrobiales bacterium]|nr:hypothetical protein [Verrucomicrobiales bacterium]|tara:strand:- start:3458 stop:4423 length:966 start_codon:yes stop_codon:yes gene_type:complete